MAYIFELIKCRQGQCGVWCVLTTVRYLGPFNLRDTVGNNRYLNMVQTFLWPQVSVRDPFNNTLFMQDGATQHQLRTYC